jgi:hypothetical protein
MRGLENVRAEFSLTVLACNLRRALKTLGVEAMTAAVAPEARRRALCEPIWASDTTQAYSDNPTKPKRSIPMRLAAPRYSMHQAVELSHGLLISALLTRPLVCHGPAPSPCR